VVCTLQHSLAWFPARLKVTYTDAAIMHSMNSVDDLVAEFNQTAKYATFCMVMCMLYANSDKTW